METALAGLGLSAFAALALGVAHFSRQGRIPTWSLVPLALGCAVALIAMTLSDWPNERLAGFWAAHSVLSATLSTLLLVGAGYLAFEARENHEQEALTASLAYGAFGGCVDHVIDIDVALSLVRREEEPRDRGEGKPLRWLRADRDHLFGSDPRKNEGTTIAVTSDATWRLAIVDECVRRLMGGMRDWAPLLSQTRDGMAVLARIAGLRNRLLELADALDRPAPAKDAAEVLSRIQHECRLLALGLELGSGVPLGRQRPGVWAPEELHLYQDDAPTSFRELLGPISAVRQPDADWDGHERALRDFRGRFGNEAPRPSRDGGTPSLGKIA